MPAISIYYLRLNYLILPDAIVLIVIAQSSPEGAVRQIEKHDVNRVERVFNQYFSQIFAAIVDISCLRH